MLDGYGGIDISYDVSTHITFSPIQTLTHLHFVALSNKLIQKIISSGISSKMSLKYIYVAARGLRY